MNRQSLVKAAKVVLVSTIMSLCTIQQSMAQVGTGNVKATLTWRTTDDLDLYITAPNGEVISYNSPMSPSGGQLDIDANAGCENQNSSPIENIFWNAEPPSGQYVASVNLYEYCGNQGSSIPFTLALRIGNETRTLTGVVNPTTRTVDFPFSYSGSAPVTRPEAVPCSSIGGNSQQLALDLTQIKKREAQLVREINQIKKFTDLSLTELNNFDSEINDYRQNIDMLSGDLQEVAELGLALQDNARSVVDSFNNLIKNVPLKISPTSGVEVKYIVNRQTGRIEEARVSVNTIDVVVGQIANNVIGTLTPGNIADFITNYSQESADAKLRITENSAKSVQLLSQELRDLRRIKQQLISKCRG